MSADEAHTIPDHIASRASRLINEAEDMRQQGADSLKQIYSDLRDDLREMGWKGSTISTEVAAFKGAISEMRLDETTKDKREEKSERIDDYVSMLSRARAREGQSYAEAKGGDHKIIDRIDTDGNRITVTVDSRIAEILGRPAHDAETGEILTQEQPVEPASQSQPVVPDLPGANTAVGLAGPALSHDGAEANTKPAPVSVSPANQASQALQADKTSEAVAPPAASLVPIPDSDVPAFLRKDVPVDVTSPEFIKLLRPFCQNLDDCHGHGRECSKCKAVRAA